MSYYDEVLAFVNSLSAAGHPATARALEDGVLGGATSGEILTNLGVALSRFIEAQDGNHRLRVEAARLRDIADRALRRVGQMPPPPPAL